MVKVKHKTDFKRSLRDAKGPKDVKNPYVPPPKPDAQLFARAEEACKELAAHDVVIRDAALEDVKTLLVRIEKAAEGTFDVPEEYAKLWRGLYYCMWHSDKPLVQLDCAERIADLVTALQSWEHRAIWMHQAWLTVHKEWGSIDKWRVNKYYSLLRLLLNRELQVLCGTLDATASEDDREVVINAFLLPILDTYETGLSGVASHLSDILIEECVAAGVSPERFMDLFFHLLLPILTQGDEYQCERIYDYVWQKMLGAFKEDDATVEWLSDILWDEIGVALEAATTDSGTKDPRRAMLVRMSEDLDEFLDKLDEAEEFAEVDDDEEVLDERLAYREQLKLKEKAQADTAAKSLKNKRNQRALANEARKALATGDKGAVKKIVHKANKAGVVVPQLKKKKQKGRANLKKYLDGAPGDLQKKAKSRHKKRRI